MPRHDIKFSPAKGSLPVMAYFAPEQLLVDESYQRSLEAETSKALIRRIAAQWDWGLCQPLSVARRPDGGLYVVDGQHRLSAAMLRGDIQQLPCVVTSFDSAEQEAAMFVALNQQRRALNTLELFKAAVASNDMTACQVVQCVKDAGLEIAGTTNNQLMKAGQVANVGGLLTCYRVHGVQVLTTALKVLRAAYPQQRLRYAGSIFPGIAAVVADELRLRTDLVKLVDELGSLVGQTQQNDWYRKFALAMIDDQTLRRSTAAVFVLRNTWRLHKYGADPAVEKPKHEREVVESAPLATYLLPAEREWCEQCDQMVSGARAAVCRDQFCKLKAKEAKAA